LNKLTTTEISTSTVMLMHLSLLTPDTVYHASKQMLVTQK